MIVLGITAAPPAVHAVGAAHEIAFSSVSPVAISRLRSRRHVVPFQCSTSSPPTWALVEEVDLVELVELDFAPLPPHRGNPIDTAAAPRSVASTRRVWRVFGDCTVTSSAAAAQLTAGVPLETSMPAAA
jgi:hypothetical protein